MKDHWVAIAWLLIMAAIAASRQVWDAAGAAVGLVVLVGWWGSRREPGS